MLTHGGDGGAIAMYQVANGLALEVHGHQPQPWSDREIRPVLVRALLSRRRRARPRLYRCSFLLASLGSYPDYSQQTQCGAGKTGCDRQGSATAAALMRINGCITSKWFLRRTTPGSSAANDRLGRVVR
jgi:hypothetical protein